MNSHSSAPSYLIVCFRFIGDVLVTTPLALSIKTEFPNARVDYLVFKGTEAILAKNPYVRKVITVPRDTTGLATLMSLFKKYDVAIAAYPSDRTAIAAAITGKYSIGLTNGWRKEWWKHIILSMHYVCYDYLHVVQNMLMPLRMLGVKPIPKVVVEFDESDKREAKTLVPAEQYVVLHPFSRNSLKYWPAKHWGRLTWLIHERLNCVPLFSITPDPSDRDYSNEILSTAHPQTQMLKKSCTLNQLAAIISGAAAYVGIDTLVTHMAASLGVPTLAIYGPSWTRYWAPWPSTCQELSPFSTNKGVQLKGNVTVVQKDWDCVPCNKDQCLNQVLDNSSCLVDIAPDDVFVELMRMVC